MRPDRLQRLLEAVHRGEMGPTEALEQLRRLPYEDLGFARVDHHRRLRQGLPEVIFGEGKSLEQILGILRSIQDQGESVLITRLAPDLASALRERIPQLTYYETARVATLFSGPRPRTRGRVLLLTAGTADLPVAEEARVVLEALGNRVEAYYDVGVAGVHRLLDHMEALQQARVVIVVAGMEGALVSVVAGLTPAPVIGVPTSIGYGVGAGGWSALLTMLNSCASGVGVVNIDSGFAAACLAHRINQTSLRKPR